MFVISLMCKGKLKKTAIRSNANDAVETATEWFEEYQFQCEDGYIAVDQEVKGEKETTRFAEIQLAQESDELKLYLDLTSENRGNPIFSSKFASISKRFLIQFFEFALIQLTDYLKERKK